MRLQYHQKVLDLLGVAPEAVDVPDSVLEFEASFNIRLPSALREWHSIDPQLELLQQILVSHHPVLLAEAFRLYAYYATPFEFLERVPIFSENQGVFQIAASMFEGDDPPVFARISEHKAPWKLHARTFSEWIYAWTWDSLTIIEEGKGYLFFRSAEAQADFFAADWQTDAPETWYGNQFFVGHRFLRGRKDGERKLVVVPGEELHD